MPISNMPVTPSTSTPPARRRMSFYKPSSMILVVKFKYSSVKSPSTRILVLQVSSKKMNHRTTLKALMHSFPMNSSFSSISLHSKSNIPNISKSSVISVKSSKELRGINMRNRVVWKTKLWRKRLPLLPRFKMSWRTKRNPMISRFVASCKRGICTRHDSPVKVRVGLCIVDSTVMSMRPRVMPNTRVCWRTCSVASISTGMRLELTWPGCGRNYKIHKGTLPSCKLPLLRPMQKSNITMVWRLMQLFHSPSFAHLATTLRTACHAHRIFCPAAGRNHNLPTTK